MIVKINTKVLREFDITPNQFVILEMIFRKMNGLIKTFSTHDIWDFKQDLQDLEEKDLVGYETKERFLKNLYVKSKYLDIAVKKNSFEELLLEFPNEVLRPDGTIDYLHTDLKRARKYYNELIKDSKMLHNHIIQALKYEVAVKKLEGKLGYMKRLPKWLHSEEWKPYAAKLDNEGGHIIEDISNPTLHSDEYGTKLL